MYSDHLFSNLCSRRPHTAWSMEGAHGSRNEEEGRATQGKGAPLSRESMSPVGHDGIRGVHVCNPSTQHGPWQRRHTDMTNGLKRITAGEPHTRKMGALDRWRSPRPRAGQSG